MKNHQIMNLMMIPVILMATASESTHLFDDWPWTTIHHLQNAIMVGKSLRGKHIEEWQQHKFQVEPVGVIDNHSKWRMRLCEREQHHGVATHLITDVGPGTREGFASHKRTGAVVGSMGRFTFIIDDDIRLHIMYDVPAARMFLKNTLALALCVKSNKECAYLTAHDMFHHDFPFMKKKKYNSDVRPLSMCYDNVCIAGSMETSARPIITLAFLPKYYHDLEESERYRSMNVSAEIYNTFMKKISSTVINH